MSELTAGVARANITPPIGIPLVGFAGRGPAEGIHDDLFATALALAAGDRRAVVFGLDLIGVTYGFAAAVRAEIERRCGVPGEGGLLCASHTPHGAATGGHASDG